MAQRYRRERRLGTCRTDERVQPAPERHLRQQRRQAHGYLAKPESGSGPGLIVIQEWWGLDDHIADLVDRFAAEGFVALAPDLFGGKVAHDSDEAGKFMQELPAEQAAKDLAGAVDFLLADDDVTSSEGRRGRLLHGRRLRAAARGAAGRQDRRRRAVLRRRARASPTSTTGSPRRCRATTASTTASIRSTRPASRRSRSARVAERRRVLLLPGRARVPQRQGQDGDVRRRVGRAGLAPHPRVPEGQSGVIVREERAADDDAVRDLTERAFGATTTTGSETSSTLCGPGRRASRWSPRTTGSSATRCCRAAGSTPSASWSRCWCCRHSRSTPRTRAAASAATWCGRRSGRGGSAHRRCSSKVSPATTRGSVS